MGALALPAPPLAAQEAAPPAAELPQGPVLTLDQERLFQQSLFGQALLARHQADLDALLAENRRIEAALEAEELDLTQRRPTLPAEEFQKLATAFDDKAEDIRAAQTNKDRVLAQRLEDERQRFFEAVAPILAALLQESGATAIIDKRAVILSFDRIDMTDAAVARIDRVLGDGSVDQPPAPADPAP
jgi:Skp family chaperone for outer membrane proteins